MTEPTLYEAKVRRLVEEGAKHNGGQCFTAAECQALHALLRAGRAPATPEAHPTEATDVVEAFRARLEREALEAGEKGAEAFTRSKYAIAEYWLCWEFRLQRLHDEFAKTFGIARRCSHSPFRTFIAEAKAALRATRTQEAPADEADEAA